MMEICPIINLRLNHNDSPIDNYTKQLARLLCDYPDIGMVELSLASDGILSILPEFCAMLNAAQLKVAFGSVVDCDLVSRLKPLALAAGTKIFAPAFDKDVWEAVSALGWDYIPGLASREDLNEVLNYIPNPSSLKVFPIYNLSLLKTLAVPYPELRLQQNIARTTLATGLKITSPREYQKIRQYFLDDNTLELSFITKQFDILDLLRGIKKTQPSISLIATGFAGIDIDEELLSAWGFDAVATRV
jgi:hypothetical protein